MKVVRNLYFEGKGLGLLARLLGQGIIKDFAEVSLSAKDFEQALSYKHRKVDGGWSPVLQFQHGLCDYTLGVVARGPRRVLRRGCSYVQESLAQPLIKSQNQISVPGTTIATVSFPLESHSFVLDSPRIRYELNRLGAVAYGAEGKAFIQFQQEVRRNVIDLVDSGLVHRISLQMDNRPKFPAAASIPVFRQLVQMLRDSAREEGLDPNQVQALAGKEYAFYFGRQVQRARLCTNFNKRAASEFRAIIKTVNDQYFIFGDLERALEGARHVGGQKVLTVTLWRPVERRVVARALRCQPAALKQQDQCLCIQLPAKYQSRARLEQLIELVYRLSEVEDALWAQCDRWEEVQPQLQLQLSVIEAEPEQDEDWQLPCQLVLQDITAQVVNQPTCSRLAQSKKQQSKQVQNQFLFQRKICRGQKVKNMLNQIGFATQQVEAIDADQAYLEGLRYRTFGDQLFCLQLGIARVLHLKKGAKVPKGLQLTPLNCLQPDPSLREMLLVHVSGLLQNGMTTPESEVLPVFYVRLCE